MPGGGMGGLGGMDVVWGSPSGCVAGERWRFLGMARAVEPKGVVYGQNAPDFSERGKAAFEAKKPGR